MRTRMALMLCFLTGNALAGPLDKPDPPSTPPLGGKMRSISPQPGPRTNADRYMFPSKQCPPIRSYYCMPCSICVADAAACSICAMGREAFKPARHTLASPPVLGNRGAAPGVIQRTRQWLRDAYSVDPRTCGARGAIQRADNTWRCGGGAVLPHPDHKPFGPVVPRSGDAPAVIHIENLKVGPAVEIKTPLSH